MLIDKNKNKQLSLPYIKTFEDFNVKITDDLKEVFNGVRKIIGEPKDSFNVKIDLKQFNFCDTILEIEVVFNPLRNGDKSYQDKDIIYYSYINIYDLLMCKQLIKIPVRIDDIHINIDKLVSTISHEIRHIYDVYTINDESDMKSFVDSYNYGIVKRGESNNEFLNFLFLVYLSLEHELIARNTMIWEMFKNCHCSKEELINLYQKSSIYNSFISLDQFNYNEVIKVPDILKKVNNFIFYFKGEDCNDINDVEKFFKNWQSYFIEKSTKYKKEALIVLDELWNLNESTLTINPPKVKNVKTLLLEIYKKYIKYV
jgi:hypothetical protein